MKYRLGITRAQVADDGTVVHILRGGDSMEIYVPEDGSEYMSTLWLSTEGGSLLLRLPLALAPGLADPGEPEACECTCSNCSGCLG